MGIAFNYIWKMDELGMLRPGMSILDIGSSNLYSATPDDIRDFLRKYGPPSLAGAEDFAKSLAAGSTYDSVRKLNESFAGALFEKANMQYESLDVADGYRTTILDLNTAALPATLRGKFDLVLNFGTTEHILNQLNCFAVIHDAAKVGGYIYHQLPAAGYLDHGYVIYTGRCFFDLAGYNSYEIIACWFDGPSGRNSVLDSLESYSAYFPVLKFALEQYAGTEQGRSLRTTNIPDIIINLICRKVKDSPFKGALELSTSVGAISRNMEPEPETQEVEPSQTRLKDKVALTLRAHPRLYALARWVYRAATRR
jgi:hypothetical protein